MIVEELDLLRRRPSGTGWGTGGWPPSDYRAALRGGRTPPTANHALVAAARGCSQVAAIPRKRSSERGLAPP